MAKRQPKPEQLAAEKQQATNPIVQVDGNTILRLIAQNKFRSAREIMLDIAALALGAATEERGSKIEVYADQCAEFSEWRKATGI